MLPMVSNAAASRVEDRVTHQPDVRRWVIKRRTEIMQAQPALMDLLSRFDIPDLILPLILYDMLEEASRA